MTGADLKEAHVSSDTSGQPAVSFTLSTNGAKIFSDYTTSHQGQYLGIVLDKTVISAPVVNQPITDGSGIISGGGFTAQTANALAIQLRYGSLPVPVKVVESRTVGATLGEESVRKSLMAGMIGLGVVILFMLLVLSSARLHRRPGIDYLFDSVPGVVQVHPRGAHLTRYCRLYPQYRYGRGCEHPDL